MRATKDSFYKEMDRILAAKGGPLAGEDYYTFDVNAKLTERQLDDYDCGTT